MPSKLENGWVLSLYGVFQLLCVGVSLFCQFSLRFRDGQIQYWENFNYSVSLLKFDQQRITKRSC